MAKTSQTGTTRVKKYTSLAELDKLRNGSIYVQNNTRNEIEGVVLITIPKLNGNGSDMVKIPKTFIPIDVTEQVDREQILRSADFRGAVSREFIKLLSPEYATLLLEQDEAKEEKKRLIAEANKARLIVNAATNVTNGEEEEEDEYIDVKDIKKDVKKSSEKTNLNAKRPMQSPKVEAAVIQIREQAMSDVQAAAKVRNLRGLRKPDLAYLAKEFQGNKKVLKVIREKLEELTSTEE